MLKVVLVEDETVIREGIRDTVPWGEYGYEFAGEAADGEMALSVIRKTKPDLLITDVKMPFMDGLSLSKIVSEEFPKTKIVIISGYDDFEYARKAIEVGVDQYLLKPITKMNLKKTLLEIKEKLDAEKEQIDYQAQFASEMHEYESFSHRRFFERLLEGEMSVMEIYDEAGKLDIEITADYYNLLFLYLKEKQGISEDQRRLFEEKQEEILHYFLRNPEYTLFGWNVNCYGILVKSDSSRIEELTQKAVRRIRQVYESVPEELQWYVALGEPVERLSALPQCYGKANHYAAYRFLVPDKHVLSTETLGSYMAASEDQNIKTVDSAKMDPEIIREFLAQGTISEVTDFVESYLLNIQEALHSNMFRDYVVLNIRFTVIAFVEAMGATQEEYSDKLQNSKMDMHIKPEEVEDYFIDMLQAAMVLRDKESDDQGSKALKRALEYIDHNYTNENISLNEVASQVKVSANHLSATFSQAMGKTFVEYLTAKRMEKAKKLLKTTDKSSGEIAQEVGYKDPHYFSFVFKKTQGQSPREYRRL